MKKKVFTWDLLDRESGSLEYTTTTGSGPADWARAGAPLRSNEVAYCRENGVIALTHRETGEVVYR